MGGCRGVQGLWFGNRDITLQSRLHFGKKGSIVRIRLQNTDPLRSEVYVILGHVHIKDFFGLS